MSTVTKRVRARVRGKTLELMEDASFLANQQEVTIGIEVPSDETATVLQTIDECAGAWTEENHPDLRTRDDVVSVVRGLRVGFERSSCQTELACVV